PHLCTAQPARPSLPPFPGPPVHHAALPPQCTHGPTLTCHFPLISASWETKTPLSTLGPTPSEDSTTVPSTARVSVPSTSHTQAQTREPERTADASLRAASAPSSLTVHVLTVSRAASWLLCKVSGFSPPDVLLTWLRDQVQVDSASFATAPPAAELGSSTFETWSVLHIRTAQAPRPDTYTCVVRHEASRRLLNASWSPDMASLDMTPPPPQSHDESGGGSTDLEDTGRLWPTFAALFLLTLLYSGFVTFIKVK
uniref:Ig-like domain-containing protein n=1 Tax=Felis catus TaxID=9685 RepID=A0ABI7Y263_FELCA